MPENHSFSEFMAGVERDGLGKPLESTSLTYCKINDASLVRDFDGYPESDAKFFAKQRYFAARVPDGVSGTVHITIPTFGDDGRTVNPGDLILYPSDVLERDDVTSSRGCGIVATGLPMAVIPAVDANAALKLYDNKEVAWQFARDFDYFMEFQDFLKESEGKPELWSDVIAKGHDEVLAAMDVPDRFKGDKSAPDADVLGDYKLSTLLVPDVVVAHKDTDGTPQPILFAPNLMSGWVNSGVSDDDFRKNYKAAPARSKAMSTLDRMAAEIDAGEAEPDERQFD